MLTIERNRTYISFMGMEWHTVRISMWLGLSTFARAITIIPLKLGTSLPKISAFQSRFQKKLHLESVILTLKAPFHATYSATSATYQQSWLGQNGAIWGVKYEMQLKLKLFFWKRIIMKNIPIFSFNEAMYAHTHTPTHKRDMYK